MTSPVQVFSTMTAPVTYVLYVDGADALKLETDRVTINGGTGLADKFLQTPMGVKTDITEAQWAWLQSDGVFRIHQENGFIQVFEGRRSMSVEDVAADMSPADGSAPTTPETFSGVEATVVTEKDGKKTTTKKK